MTKNVYVFCMIMLCSVLLCSESPTNVEIHIDNDNSVLSWSDTTNADFYYIYRSTKPDTDFVKIDSVNVTTYIDSEAVIENKYFYYVTAGEEEILTVTDIDGNVYQTMVFGNQEWMLENLKVTHYRNGDPIPHVTGNSSWAGLSSGAYCYYDNDQANGDIYGALYNWYAVDDSRGLAPEGWHIPTDNEIKVLEMHLGMSQNQANSAGYRGTNEGSKLAGYASLWYDGVLENDPEFGSSGFDFLPGGYRYYGNGDFSGLDSYGHFWSVTDSNIIYAWHRKIEYSNTQVFRNDLNGEQRNGFSVRCVRD